jgi:cytochrome c-type biogenesis protein CcmH
MNKDDKPAPASAAAQAPEPAAKVPMRLWLAISGFVLAVAVAGYVATGTPEASQPEGHAAGAAQMEELVTRLEERLKRQPGDAEGWAMLGRSKMVLGRMDESVAAYAQVLKLKPDDASALADYADALGAAHGRSLEGEPARLIERALKLEPDHLKARALAGARAFQAGRFDVAVQHWERIVQVAPADHPFVELARRGLSEAQSRLTAPQPPAQAAAGTKPARAPPDAAVAGSSITGTVRLSAALKDKAGAEDRVFIFARPAAGGMPLAIQQLRVKDLPAPFKLDDSQAMSPASRLSQAETVVVTARVSKSGQATPSSGDLEGQSAAVKPGSSGLVVEIANVRP